MVLSDTRGMKHLFRTARPQAGTAIGRNLSSSDAFLVSSRIDKKAGNSYDPSLT